MVKFDGHPLFYSSHEMEAKCKNKNKKPHQQYFYLGHAEKNCFILYFSNVSLSTWLLEIVVQKKKKSLSNIYANRYSDVIADRIFLKL